MSFWLNRLKGQGGYTLIESMMVISILTIVIGAIVSLMQLAYSMDRQAQDGFEAQNEGRRVISEMVRLMRPGQNINADDSVPIIYALNDGTLIDIRVDREKDGVPEIARFRLDQDESEIILYLDEQDGNGLYNYQVAGNPYLTHYGEDKPLSGAFDSSETIANRIVNAPPGGVWGAQTPTTKAEDDFRLFTFYGTDFDDPLDTVGVDMVDIWPNFIRGVKIYIWSDIQPMKIPSPFGIQTSVHLRNIQGE